VPVPSADELAFDVVDVFADEAFAGNQLAVVHDTAGLTDAQLLALTREFGFSETAFPSGGGGYVVATKLLGSKLGVVSGCALVVDYVLTISISIASGCDQLFSLLTPGAQHWKFATEVVVTGALIVLNLRGSWSSCIACA